MAHHGEFQVASSRRSKKSNLGTGKRGTAIIVGALAFLLWGCPPPDKSPPPPPPDFTKPGSDGQANVGQPMHEATYDVANETTTPPPVCGVTFQVTGRANEPAAGGRCRNLQNYQNVYNRAVAMADATLAGYVCPQNCRPLQSAVTKRRWECFRRNLIASVEKDAICPRPDRDPPPQGLGNPPPPPFNQRNRGEGMPGLPIFEETKDGTPVACPATDLALVTYKKTVPNCRGLNFRAHVQAAESKAQAYHDTQSCAVGCNKQPYQALRRVWNCTGQGNVARSRSTSTSTARGREARRRATSPSAPSVTQGSPTTLGVLMLETRFSRPPGDVGAPETWGGRAIFRTVARATVARVVQDRDLDHSVVEGMQVAARALEADGARLITTSCGLLAPLQGTLQSAVRVPVVASALALVPLLRAVFGPDAPLGILTFDARALGPRHFGPWWDEILVIEGVEDGRELHRIISQDLTELNLDLAAADVIAAARRIVARQPEVPALIMECANFPPYRAAVARAVARPVFDLVGLVHWMASGLPPAEAISGALQSQSRLLDCRDQAQSNQRKQGDS